MTDTKVLISSIFLVVLTISESRNLQKRETDEYLFEYSDTDGEGSGFLPIRLCQEDDDCVVFDSKCINGECVLTESNKCPKDMHYVECLNRCAKTCQSSNSTTTCREHAFCKEGCECIDGFYWVAERGVCVPKAECDQLVEQDRVDAIEIASKCPPHSFFRACPSKCPPKTCENKANPCKLVSKGCGAKQCVCRDGFVQASDDIADGCIPEYECEGIFTTASLVEIEGSGMEEQGDPVELIKDRGTRSDSCPAHSELKDCVPLTPVNCYMVYLDAPPAECGHQRCDCEDGFVRADSGDEAPCIPVEACHVPPLIP
uniref:TIL domain-containing protein n=1 Tax=Panagrellus redivivus TaxID=6233 RepID=A0A7E4V115_PANRE